MSSTSEPPTDQPISPTSNRPLGGDGNDVSSQRVDILRRTDFFRDAPGGTLEPIALRCSTQQLTRGDILFHEGDRPDSIHLVLSGRIAIVTSNPIDRRESVLALMESGDLFGELGMLDNGPRSASARALEQTEVLVIPYGPVIEMFTAQPTMLWNVTRLLASRLRTMDEALADSVFLDVTGRTAKRLLELADGADEFILPVTQEELAGMVGASRERVNKAIASFIRLGWLDQHDRRYRILQRERLEQRSL
jgi:CRP-like cAMP-binding protein